MPLPAHPVPLFTLKRQMFKFVGANFRIYDADGKMVLFCHQKGFKLKEDIRLYYDETATQLAMHIQARQILDFSAAYDVIDVQTGKVGALKRKGWSSMVRDEWIVMDEHDREIGKVIEDNMALALVRRFLSNLVPQNYDLLMLDGSRACDLRQKFNPFLYHLDIDLRDDPQGRLDRRLAVAAAVLLAAIEGKQGG